MATDYSTERELINGEYHAYKRAGLVENVNGASVEEGVLIRFTTVTNNSIESSNIHIGVRVKP